MLTPHTYMALTHKWLPSFLDFYLFDTQDCLMIFPLAFQAFLYSFHILNELIQCSYELNILFQ